MCSVLAQFIQQSIDHADNIAIVYGDTQLTYQQLDKESDRLCAQLQLAGIGAEHIVPLLAQRTPAFIIGMLAIWKTGASYIPIDIHTPQTHIAHILTQSRSPAILICHHQASLPPLTHGQRIIAIDQARQTRGQPAPFCLPDADNLAWVIFTADHSGNLQGVMIAQGALSNLVNWHNRHFDVDNLSRCTLRGSTSQDVAQCEVWSPLVAGATLVLAEDDEILQHASKLLHFFADNGITHAFVAGSMLNEIVGQPQPINLALRYLFTAGEKGAPLNLKRVSYQLIHYYGPPENTLFTTCNPLLCASKQPPESIGLPIAGAEIFILNEQLQPVTGDKPGEIFIAGPGLSIGYLNNPGLTKNKFVRAPCAQGKRLYRSGERARWLPDGRIQSLGHTDSHLAATPGIRIAHLPRLRTLRDDIYLADNSRINPWFDDYQIRAPQLIFLTGATGFVGSQLLADLLHTTRAHIYCLVRSNSAVHGWKRLQDTLSRYLIPLSDEDLARVHVLAGDLAVPRFGLEWSEYRRLCRNIDIIYHSASTVSLTQSYACMQRDNVQGLREVIRFACNQRTKPLVLLSTLAVYSWDPLHTGNRILHEEDSLDDNLPAVICDSGYVRSKWVMEKMADLAAAHGLPLMTFRSGCAICHSQTGASEQEQWWARLVRTCIDTGSIPQLDNLREGLTTIDYITRAICYISRKPQALGHKFNLVHDAQNDLTLRAFFRLLENYFGFRFLSLPFPEWLAQWDRNSNAPLYPLLGWFKDNISAGQSAVQLYQGIFQWDCCNVKRFLQGSDLHEPIFTRELLMRYLCHSIGQRERITP